MIEIPKLPPPFHDRMAAYVGDIERHYGPATVEGNAKELKRLERKIAFMENYLADEERIQLVRDAQRYPTDHILMGVLAWLKALTLLLAGGVIQWLFTRGKHV